MTETDDAPPVVCQVILFDRVGDPVPEDYRDNFDEGECQALSVSLRQYLQKFAEENEQNVSAEVDGISVELKRDDGSSMDIECFGSEIFDIQRWESPFGENFTGQIKYDLACELDADRMITLAHYFIINGTLDA
jgi:hypothetical protein